MRANFFYTVKYLVLLFLTSLTFAQNNSSIITVYSDPYFKGLSAPLNLGGYDYFLLGVDNDKISSIKIPYGVIVTVFTDSNFRGVSKTFSNDVYFLGDFDDKISSIIIAKNSNENSYSNNNYSNNNSYNSNAVTIYADDNFSGQSFTLKAGRYDYFSLGIGNDKISSIRVPKGFSVQAYTDASFQGISRVYTNDINNVGDFNDKISSIIISKSNNNYNPNNVTFYKDENFSGQSSSLNIGNYDDYSLALGNDQISSIKIPKGFVVTVFSDAKFSGKSKVYTSDVNIMPDFNDVISSIIISKNSNNNYMAPNSVVVYLDLGYQGQSSVLSQGYHDLNDLGIGNDQISSIKVPNGYTVTVFVDAKYSGSRRVYTNDVSNVGDFNDKISSIIITKN